jgi:proteasome lid subunit RPN8/RPN11
MKTISLTAEQIGDLIRIAKEALPNECCAFLLGNPNEDGNVVKILPVRNIDESPISFSIDPEEILNVYNLADSKGMQVTAIFHSHPAKATPSSTDVKFMQVNPVIWIIYSTTENQLKAFVYDEEMVKEIAMRIINARE